MELLLEERIRIPLNQLNEEAAKYGCTYRVLHSEESGVHRLIKYTKHYRTITDFVWNPSSTVIFHSTEDMINGINKLID